MEDFILNLIGKSKRVGAGICTDLNKMLRLIPQ